MKNDFLCSCTPGHYEILEDGSVDIEGIVELEHFKGIRLPVQFNIIRNGFMDLNHSSIRVLDGLPRKIIGGYDIYRGNTWNGDLTLEGCLGLQVTKEEVLSVCQITGLVYL
jgi:hypothetical protein